jgi:hypothetical protein
LNLYFFTGINAVGIYLWNCNKIYRIRVDIDWFDVYNITKEKHMKELIDMSQAHLDNVAQEIQRLEQQKQLLDVEIDKLNQYFKEGNLTLERYREEGQE